MKIYDKKLAYPYFVWMTLFTVVPLIIVVYYALTDADGNFTLDNLLSISGYGSVFARSLLLALIATVICLIIAFPVGYFLSRLRVNKQHIMLMLVMLPMWMNFLLPLMRGWVCSARTARSTRCLASSALDRSIC